MLEDIYIFAQVRDFIPWYQFDKLVAKHKGDWHAKDFNCYNQSLYLLFGQLTGCGSLRDIYLCFEWIKQNIVVKTLWGYSENAVRTHLWVAVITYLVVARSMSSNQRIGCS